MSDEKTLLLRSLGMAQIPEIESEVHDLNIVKRSIQDYAKSPYCWLTL
jgi:hypothetical protein